MARHVNDISRLMGRDNITVLSLDAAKDLMLAKAKPETSESLKRATHLDYILNSFNMGGVNIGEVREAAENLLEAVDDDLGLAYAITTIPEGAFNAKENEVTTLGSTKFVDAVHHMMEISRSYLSGRCKGDVLCESGLMLSQLCYNAFRNASIIESHHGSSFMLEYNAKPLTDAFDRILVETVSSGAIGAVAMRPAILGSKKGPKDVFAPKKKNRWYLKYAIE